MIRTDDGCNCSTASKVCDRLLGVDQQAHPHMDRQSDCPVLDYSSRVCSPQSLRDQPSASISFLEILPLKQQPCRHANQRVTRGLTFKQFQSSTTWIHGLARLSHQQQWPRWHQELISYSSSCCQWICIWPTMPPDTSLHLYFKPW